jgi:hypothetical protein
MTSKLAALAKILLLPRRSAPAFVRPLQRILTTDEIRTEPQENNDDEEQLEEQQQNKGLLLEALMTRRGFLNSNDTKYHQGEHVGPITDPIAKHQLREVMNEYYRSAINNNNNNKNSNSNSNSNFNFNTQSQDDQDTPPASSSWSSASSSQDVVVSSTTPDLSSIPVGGEYLYLAQ